MAEGCNRVSIAGIDEPECLTCLFQRRYDEYVDAGERPYAEQLEEANDLLDIANEIAVKRCEGNARAVKAVLN